MIIYIFVFFFFFLLEYWAKHAAIPAGWKGQAVPTAPFLEPDTYL